ncbi:putative Fimbrial protein precursor [Xenorhabdus poinarii G6]|uniref:Putative Fimbrial protein n=1 Tax=Xenorhabdus poinarii G6 TaxID=1354304 RepID=A0A068R309_9GAMM|nr:fimbrial protein [Xenorhabdus poinarii]CDG21419.1 putative Fimbrial protein precursor [Xenorhabdus poinarii G6]
MKTTLLISSLFVSSVFMSAAHAIDGQIKFTGKITDSACKVDPSSANQTVNMGTIAANSFDGPSSTSSPSRFSIKLSECPKSNKSVQVKFDGQTDASRKYLALEGGNAAKGVAIALYEDDNNTPIPMFKSSRSQDLSDSKTQELHFIAKYIATSSPVTPGLGDAVTNFTITYN